MASILLSDDSNWFVGSNLFYDVFDNFRLGLDSYLDGCRAVKGLDLTDPAFRNTILGLLSESVKVMVESDLDSQAVQLLSDLEGRIAREIV